VFSIHVLPALSNVNVVIAATRDDVFLPAGQVVRHGLGRGALAPLDERVVDRIVGERRVPACVLLAQKTVVGIVSPGENGSIFDPPNSVIDRIVGVDERCDGVRSYILNLGCETIFGVERVFSDRADAQLKGGQAAVRIVAKGVNPICRLVRLVLPVE